MCGLRFDIQPRMLDNLRKGLSRKAFLVRQEWAQPFPLPAHSTQARRKRFRQAYLLLEIFVYPSYLPVCCSFSAALASERALC